MQVAKLDHLGNKVLTYEAQLIERGETWALVEAKFSLDVQTDYHHFKKGDRMLEWFYTDRWYNIFQMHDVETDALKGWYCNITRPADITDTRIQAEDLALDVFIYPNGETLVLDEDEFEALALDAATKSKALAALDSLLALVTTRADMFQSISDHL